MRSRASGGDPHGRPTPPVPDDPAEARSAAYALGLRWLALRELAEAAVRRRYRERGFPPDVVDDTVARLIRAGVLDDRRAVRAAARTLVLIRHRGRARAVRELEAKGFSREAATEALAELLDEAGERDLIERLLDQRLRGRPPRAGDQAGMRRLYAALLRRGYAPALVRDAVRRRFAHAGAGALPPDDDAGGD